MNASASSQDSLSAEDRTRIWEQLDDIFARIDRVFDKHAHVDRNLSYGRVVKTVDRHPCLVSDQQVKRRLMAVDGLIGAGKTTLCRDLMRVFVEQQPDHRHHLVAEPVLGEALKMFYADPDGMAERFQLLQCCLCVSSARLALIETGLSSLPGTVLLDRSPLGNLSFALVHFLAGRISEEGFRLYKASLCSAGVVCMPHTVHLYVRPEVASERILKRLRKTDPSRACESGIPLEYLQKLDAVMLMISAYVAAKKRSRVRFVDWNQFGDTDSVTALEPVQIDMDRLRKVQSHQDLLQLTGIMNSNNVNNNNNNNNANDDDDDDPSIVRLDDANGNVIRVPVGVDTQAGQVAENRVYTQV